MPSVVDVCNRAIQKVGGKPITALTDSSVTARAINRCYEVTRDSLLRDSNWNFSIKRATIAASATAPDWGFDNQYPIPADCIRIMTVDGYKGVTESLGSYGVNESDYQVESNHILLDDTGPIKIRYVARITDPNEMDEQFQELWAAAMALEIVEEVTQSNTKKEYLLNDYKIISSRARRSDGVETPGEAIFEDSWILARQ
jgi:hypothetical protein